VTFKAFLRSFPFFLIALQVEGQFHFRAGFRLKNPEVCRGMEKFARLDGLKGASWGLAIRNVKDGSLLAAKSEEENFIPASNMKLLTSMNAYHHLGEDYRFVTEFFIEGNLENGILNGNLRIMGSGDPTIGTEGRDKLKSLFFRKAVQILKEKGIRRISGRIILEEDENPYKGIQKDWSWGDIGNYYGAGIYQYNINENQFHHWVEAKKEGANAIIRKKDSLNGGLELQQVKLETTPVGSPDLAYYFWVPGTSKVRLSGSIPQSGELQKVKGALHNPAELFLKTLSAELRLNGIEIEEAAIEGGTRISLGKISSPALPEIAAEVNLNSHNLFTESLSYALCKKDDRCLENGWTHLERFAKLTGFSEGYYLADGSGLSLSNRVSPASISQALVWANNQKWRNSFLNTLPVAGESGTMRNFCKGAKGKIRAKSGTLTRTLCYSGFAETDKGQIAFSVMINNYHGTHKEMKAELGKLLESFVRIH
jgi:D-alanyl-D-alanine carboxypeptidase/D-alanyl-D-alanine-endopeptidase (penicillin-binding protein 4)